MNPPPGYPFAGPIAAREHSDDAGLGLVGFVFVFAGTMAGVGFLLVAILVSQVVPSTATMGRTTASTGLELASGPEAADASGLRSPTIESLLAAPPRNVPVHPARFLEGCGEGDLTSIEDALNAAIARGAPLFNDGDAPGCVVEYRRAAEKLADALPARCSGPIQALTLGTASAAQADSASASAWALRDAFDGLLEVVERSRAFGVSNL